MKTNKSSFVFVHRKRDIDLVDLVDVFSSNYLLAIVSIANRVLQKKAYSTAYEPIKALRVYADFIRSLTSCSIKYYFLSQHPGLPSRLEWISHVNRFEKYLTEEIASVTQRNKHRRGMGFWWKQLAKNGICYSDLRLKSESVNKSGEVKRKGSKVVFDESLNSEYYASVASRLVDQFLEESVALREKEELKVVLSNVVYELDKDNGIELKTLDHRILASKIQDALQKRLEGIRKCAEDNFNEAIRIRDEGFLRASSAKKNIEIIRDFIEKDVGSGQVNVYRNRIEKLSNKEFEDAFFAYLLFYDGKFQGLGVRYQAENVKIYNRLSKEARRRGINLGVEKQQSIIGASKQLLVSAQILLIYDLVANPESVQRIAFNADYEVFRDLSAIDWCKPRSSQKILTILDGELSKSDLSVFEVVKKVREATRFYRKQCIEDDKNKLFLYNTNNFTSSKSRASKKKCSNPSTNFFCDGTREMLREYSKGLWSATPLQIRNSLILLNGMLEGVESAQKTAKHVSSRTTTGYLNKYLYKFKMEEKIFEFIDWLEALVTLDVDGYAEKVEMDKDAYAKNKDKVVQYIFGGAECRDPFAGVQSGEKEGQACGAFTKCMLCENRQNYFYASFNNVVHLLLWNDAIKYAYSKGIISINEEWYSWARFIRVILDRLLGNKKYRAVLYDAEIEIEGIKNNPYLSLFEKGVD